MSDEQPNSIELEEGELDLGTIQIRMVLREDGVQVVRTNVIGGLPAVTVFGMLEFAKMYFYDEMSGEDDDDDGD